VEAVADLLRDDDTPPPSGVRFRVPDALALVAPLRTVASVPLQADAEVLREVGEEVFFAVYGVLRALSPLQGAWFRLGLVQAGRTALTVATWQVAPSKPPAMPLKKQLRRRWPELVPGHGAMSRLASLMVDVLC
jgi:hypothetical protein